MAIAALVLFAGTILLTGVRALIQRRRTGDWGNRQTLAPRGTAGWWAHVVLDLGFLTAGAGAPIAALAGLPALAVADHAAVRGLGLGLAVFGVLAVFGCQLALGASWRIGVDETERTALVTSGLFGLVRNPIFTAVVVVFLGLALMVPNLVAVVGLAITFIGVEVQVRLVEEPYLRRVHDTAYTEYASRVGRFLPGIGRLRPEHQHRT